MTQQTIQSGISVYEERLRTHRQALHMIPEVGYHEFKTQEYVLRQLRILEPDDLRVFTMPWFVWPSPGT